MSAETLTIDPRILEALDLEPDLARAGNVAANAYRLAVGMADAIHTGWAGMDASTDFLVGIVRDVEDALVDYDRLPGSPPLADLIGDLIDPHEIADGAVPPYNSDRMRALVELDPLGQLGVGPFGVESGATFSEQAGQALYEIAGTIADALLWAIADQDTSA